ncbi:PREDICTED: RING-H2 finger protein ATL52-like [Nelumbo nucifera]|uniref:RING-type E3 ubiquitin transferase n=2 Tax=Nelumbo nucifera TaxID=4432 RepID=A0A822ZVC3_NELNU|nr:PREDICTED: RING-H2 finger protein ATL52-like [Nelumbo nucifera]DAD47481.1 TPA_asm: hypothetical protein HUJ06_017418 [Nelumbo nucifera]
MGMAYLENPQTWIPYESSKDCSQGFCTIYCPQWCYIVYPPPPPFGFSEEQASSPNLSPLVIAIIGILASAFLLVSYYTLISKYCGNSDSVRRIENHEPSADFDDDPTPNLNYEEWQVSTRGLEESLIKSITLCKYKRGDGLIEGTDCSVCLSEFQEDESLRLLPKCSHAFHVSCIDTWLKSHSNCPLCRAHVASPPPNPSPLQSLPPVPETRPESTGSSVERLQENDIVVAIGDAERSRGEETRQTGQSAPKIPLRALSDLGDAEQRNIIIEVQQIRRSVSMDSSCQGRLSIADILSIREDVDSQEEDHRITVGAGSSKQGGGSFGKSSSNRNRVLHCVMSPVAMKRSFSSGRFMLTRHGRGRNSIIPL